MLELNALFVEIPEHKIACVVACIHMSLEFSACSLEMQPLEHCGQLCLVEGQVW